MIEQKKYDVFISYSRHDYVDKFQKIIPNNHVSRIMQALNDAGFTYWIDEKGIYSGDEFAGVIADAIDASSVFVFVSSESSNESPWTIGEIATAQEAKKKIIPVRIDSSRYHKSLRVRLNALDYIDFSKNPQKGSSELVRSIKAFFDTEKANIKQKEEEKQRIREIQKIEEEITVIESQITDFKKTIVNKERELKIAQMDLEECEKNLQRKKITLSNLQQPKTNDYSLYLEPDRDNQEDKSTIQRNPSSHLSKSKKNQIKNEREFSNIILRSKKIPYVFERDTISNSIHVTHFIEILENEYGIHLDADDIYSCKTIGRLKDLVLNYNR